MMDLCDPRIHAGNDYSRRRMCYTNTAHIENDSDRRECRRVTDRAGNIARNRARAMSFRIRQSRIA